MGRPILTICVVWHVLAQEVVFFGVAMIAPDIIFSGINFLIASNSLMRSLTH